MSRARRSGRTATAGMIHDDGLGGLHSLVNKISEVGLFIALLLVFCSSSLTYQ